MMDPHSRRVPLDKRKRTEMSCDKCKSRKQKCDRLLGQTKCRYCELNGIVCSTTQPRKQRIYANDEDLRSRLNLLESLVKGLLPEADLSSNDELQHLGKSLGIPVPVPDDTGRSQGKPPSNEGVEDEHAISLLPDQQGQVQYIGPSSSFAFHNKLRALMGSYTSREFAMFGRNAADINGLDSGNLDKAQQGVGYYDAPSNGYKTIVDVVNSKDGAVLDSLVDTYFDFIHSDFPVLHEASFREAYEIWTSSTTGTDPAWVCSLLCVLILARRVTPLSIAAEAEQKWWRHVQNLLPTVLFTTNIHTVQALLLAALHLHNTNHRDACWNLTGTALRVAVAMGLHRDDIKHLQGPLRRELRKQLWWTLYAFEQMQVSSYDRPSAIGDTISSASCPNERIVGFAGHCPQDLLKHSQQLIVLLGSTCKVLSTIGTVEDAYSRPLSPASGILRDMRRWKETLPPHLRLEASDSLAPSSQRPVLLLHAQFGYITLLLSKPALLRVATLVSKVPAEQVSQSLQTVAATCIDAGKKLARNMQRLEGIGKFNPFTWWDIFYTMISALVLILDIFCQARQGAFDKTTESHGLLQDLSSMVEKHLQHPLVPGSMRAWGGIVVDLAALSEQLVSLSARPADNQVPVSPDPQLSATENAFPIGYATSASPIEAISSEYFNLLQSSFTIGLNGEM